MVIYMLNKFTGKFFPFVFIFVLVNNININTEEPVTIAIIHTGIVCIPKPRHYGL